MEAHDNLISVLRERVREAEKVAKELSKDGDIIGRVTRFEFIHVGEKPVIKVEISFEDYFKNPVKRGEILGIASIIPRVIMLGIVEDIMRGDMLANLGIKEIRGREDPSTIITSTIITLDPVSEMAIDDFLNGKPSPKPVVSPIDPQSPVFRPKEEVIEAGFNIPKEGVVIGNVFSGFEKINARVILDENTLTHHVLIIGTTGSGKTTLMKSMIFDKSLDKQVVVFDRQGDFVRFALKNLKNVKVVVPLTNKIKDRFVDLIAERYCEGFEKGLSVECEGGVTFIPFSLKFSQHFKDLPKYTPYLSEQASMSWEAIYNRFTYDLREFLKEALKDNKETVANQYSNSILSNLKLSHLVNEKLPLEYNNLTSVSKRVGSDRNPVIYKIVDKNANTFVLNLHDLLNYVMYEDLDLAPSTGKSVNRALKTMNDYGIFDVENTVNELDEEILESDYVIVDLSFILEYTYSVEPLSIIAYKILDSIYQYKDRLYKKGVNDRLTLLMIDEAHEFFPQSKGEVSKETVEEMINRIMRLGRVRKLGAVLATHVPEDLNPLILQLSNTKIIMRNGREVLEKMGAKDFEDLLITAPPGLALVKSLKFDDLLMQTVINWEQK